jgi:hypothetical protein
MQTVSIRIFLIISLFAVINPSLLPAATEQRIALVIGNSAYSSGPLKNPVNDAADMAATLQKLGFAVTLKKNVNLRAMEESLAGFGEKLKKGGIGLFFYAGHGLQVNGINYFVPIGATINRETDIKYETMDVGKVLDEMANAGNGMNIVILDACRDNPFSRSFRNASRGLAIVSNAPAGTFISYSTGPGNVARDGDGRNSPYTDALVQSLKEPGITIEQVFKKVRAKLGKETGGKQIPWEVSSLQGEFYFIPGSASKSAAMVPAGKIAAINDELDDENTKLESERRRLEEEKAAFSKKKALDEKRRQIEEERERLAAEQEAERQLEADRKRRALERKQPNKTTAIAMVSRPSVSNANEIRRDGRFIAYDNGTVLDTRTNLMWAAKDNGYEINWANAKSYCENYRGGGYTDWRMPTQDELAGLHDASKSRPGACNRSYNIHIATELIDITCFDPWATETPGADAAPFSFYYGVRRWPLQPNDSASRALPVRYAK